MKHLLFTLLIPMVCSGQERLGIQFEKGLDWNAVKEKAKAENKHIFIDIYTTWCGPCKYMSDKIFPVKEVGDYFNKNFINIKVQMDTSKRDNQEIKNWYRDAQTIMATYKIGSYPTYLFLNPKSDLVHTITGATDTASEFLKKAESALDPERQYTSMKKKYHEGKQDSLFMVQLIEAAKTSGDYSLMASLKTPFSPPPTFRNLFFILPCRCCGEGCFFNIFLNDWQSVNYVTTF